MNGQPAVICLTSNKSLSTRTPISRREGWGKKPGSLVLICRTEFSFFSFFWACLALF